jgi:predicted oxidoreductase
MGDPHLTRRKRFTKPTAPPGDFIDTANVYTGGTSEKFVGDLVAGHREEMVIATKYTNAAPGSDANAGGNHRNLMQSVKASLRRLSIDLVLAQLVFDAEVIQSSHRVRLDHSIGPHLRFTNASPLDAFLG